MTLLFFVLSLVWAWLAYNVYRPTFAPPRRAVVSFFAGWLTGELALHHIVLQALIVAVLMRGGALTSPLGTIALLITVASWAALARFYWRGRLAAGVVEQALREMLGAAYRTQLSPEARQAAADPVSWREVLAPFPIRHPDVERVRDVQFTRAAGINLKLDVYRHRSHPTGCPVLLQIHGGGWVIGSKNEQGLPLMLRMAARGWVCVSVDYRLSPHATFPDHLVDLKRAIQWIREHGHEYGANPDYIVATGGSAGGHLCSLVALTANDPEYQPGFEQVDTRVQACVPIYGVYDFTNRDGYWHHDAIAELLESKVMKASLSKAPGAYAKASPMSRVHAGAPPFFIVHGELDTLVPVEEARRFAEILRDTSDAPVGYAEIPGAQHAFEIFPSLRAGLVIRAVERFLQSQHEADQHTQQIEEPRAAVG